jgi:hypothetical protein
LSSTDLLISATAKAHDMVEQMRRKGDHDGADTWLYIIEAMGELGGAINLVPEVRAPSEARIERRLRRVYYGRLARAPMDIEELVAPLRRARNVKRSRCFYDRNGCLALDSRDYRKRYSIGRARLLPRHTDLRAGKDQSASSGSRRWKRGTNSHTQSELAPHAEGASAL